MNSLIVNDKNITNMIYEVRGKQVMLDSDLLYILFLYCIIKDSKRVDGDTLCSKNLTTIINQLLILLMT